MKRTKVNAKKLSDEVGRIKSVLTVWSEQECNNLLANGWTLIDAGRAHIDTMGYNCKTCYTLGKQS